jgi:flagellar biogenesis protein FliO
MDGRCGVIARFAQLIARWRPTPRVKVHVLAAHPLASGLGVYVIDVDGRRTVLAAGSHAICVLAAYPSPRDVDPEGQRTTAV